MQKEEVLKIVEQCFHGDPPSCAHACPFHLDIRSFCEKATVGRWNTIYKYMRDSLIFPVVVQRICHMPCAEKCQRPLIGDEAINMTMLEEAALKYSTNKDPIKFSIPPKKETVAIVGAGVAGLSVALNLAQKRYNVTIFEKEDSILGSLFSHENAEAFEEDIKLQFSVVSCEFNFNKLINSIDELSSFDAVFIATGYPNNSFENSKKNETINEYKLSKELNALIKTYDDEFFSTSKEGIFLGGELCGYSKIQSIADSVKIANVIESYLMTGKPLKEKEEKFLPERIHMLDHSEEQSKPRVIPSDGNIYTIDEAKSEASRCFLCDCRLCLDKCEMLASFAKRPQKLAQEAYADTNVAPPFSSCTLTKEVFSCNECDYCKTICPVDINLGDLFQIAKSGRVKVNTEPKAYHDYWLKDFEFASEQASYVIPPDNVFLGNSESEGASDNKAYMFFPGCKLGENNPDYVLKSYDILRKHFGAGLVLNCCGVPALWAGEEKLFHSHLAVLTGIWKNAGKPTLVFGCTYCEKVFRKYLPDIESISFYSLLAENPDLLPRNTNFTNAFTESPAIFDPCAATFNQEDSCSAMDGLYATTFNQCSATDNQCEATEDSCSAIEDPCATTNNQCVDTDEISCKSAVRKLCSNIGIEPLEITEKGKCCGFGGHMRGANDELYDKIVDNRISAEDIPYIVYCANCLTTFRSKGKECKHILDLILDIDESQSGANLQDKKNNAIEIKRRLMKKNGEGDFTIPANPWDYLLLNINEETQIYMDNNLILSSDLKETIFKAEQSGNMFMNSSSNTFLAFLEKPNIIFWVEFKKTEEKNKELNTDCFKYEIMNTYFHRMHPRNEKKA